MWIFGYGSLVWKADFPYVKKVVGYVKGYERKFWQASIDHRGVPEKPGRVVTLVPAEPDAKVWGVAYEINDEETEGIAALNDREKRYQQIDLTFHPNQPIIMENVESGDLERGFLVSVFIGDPAGPLYLGEASISDIAHQIANSKGPSGPNCDYVLKLAEFMRSEVPLEEDPHLFAIETALHEVMSKF